MSESTASRFKPLYAILAAVLLVLLLMWMEGAFKDKVEPGLTPPAESSSRVTGPLARVTRRSEDEVFAWPATVTARIVSEVSSKIPGRIMDMTVRAGDRVRRGQVLARLDESEVIARLGQARSALTAAEAEAGRARADAQRLENLFAKEAATRQDLDTALAAARTTEARVQEARAGVLEIESRRGETLLKAPFDGVVVRRNLEPGSVTMPGVAVLTIQQSSQLRVETAVPANCAGGIRTGADLKVKIANPERDFRVIVDEIQPAADPSTRTVLIKARLPENSGVQPGAFGWLYQSCGQSQVLLIPASAVSRIGQLESVRLVVNGKSRLRHVRTGKTYNGQIEIQSGLQEGDMVEVGGQR